MPAARVALRTSKATARKATTTDLSTNKGEMQTTMKRVSLWRTQVPRRHCELTLSPISRKKRHKNAIRETTKNN